MSDENIGPDAGNGQTDQHQLETETRRVVPNRQRQQVPRMQGFERMDCKFAVGFPVRCQPDAERGKFLINR